MKKTTNDHALSNYRMKKLQYKHPHKTGMSS